MKENHVWVFQERFLEIFKNVSEDLRGINEAFKGMAVITEESDVTVDIIDKKQGELGEPMEVSFYFDDAHMEAYLVAKRSMEKEDIGREMCHDEAIGRLAKYYLDTKSSDTQ